MNTPEDDRPDRLDRLEAEVAAMRAEIAVLRGALRYRDGERAPTRPSPSGANAPAAATPGAAPNASDLSRSERRSVARPTISVEQAVGRYGALAIGTICVLLGFGTFITWAIARGLLGPEARVALGAAGAIAFAAGGLWLRIKGTREFGNILLAIALAAAQVVCWGAGPHLHIVPPIVALGIALVASALLAELALRHDEETLCAIGFGGAAIAPFVTSGGGGHIAAPIYGVVVVALAAAALRGRQWFVARRVVAGSIALFELASLIAVQSGRPADYSFIERVLPLTFPLAVMIAVVVASRARHRGYFVRWAASAALFAAIVRAFADGGTDWGLAITVVTAIVTALALGVARPTPSEREAALAERPAKAEVDPGFEPVADGALIPLAFLGVAIAETPGVGSRESVALAAGWSLAALFATYWTRAEEETEWYAVTASLSVLCLSIAAFVPDATLGLFAVVGAAVLLGALDRAMPRRAFGACARGALTVSAAFAILNLHDRVSFAYAPFATIASLQGAAVVAGWAAVLLLARMPGATAATSEAKRTEPQWRTIAQFGCAVTAFLWIREELAGGWSATTATVLLVAYYGVTGGIAIWVGRRIRERAVRLVGLGLTMLAAGLTLVQAFNVPDVAIRVGLFFLVSGFLIGVAYWYRRGAEDAGEEPVAADPT